MMFRVLLDLILNQPQSPETVRALLAEVEEAQEKTRQRRTSAAGAGVSTNARTPWPGETLSDKSP